MATSGLSDEDRTLVFAFLEQEAAVREAMRKHDKAAEKPLAPQVIRFADVVHAENLRLKVLFSRIVQKQISEEEIQKLRIERAKRRFMKLDDNPLKDTV